MGGTSDGVWIACCLRFVYHSVFLLGRQIQSFHKRFRMEATRLDFETMSDKRRFVSVSENFSPSPEISTQPASDVQTWRPSMCWFCLTAFRSGYDWCVCLEVFEHVPKKLEPQLAFISDQFWSADGNIHFVVGSDPHTNTNYSETSNKTIILGFLNRFILCQPWFCILVPRWSVS